MSKEYPIKILEIRLPSEPLTADRAYCLQQVSSNQWSTYYLRLADKVSYTMVFFDNLNNALIGFQNELLGQMLRYNYFISLFFKYRQYITTQEKYCSIDYEAALAYIAVEGYRPQQVNNLWGIKFSGIWKIDPIYSNQHEAICEYYNRYLGGEETLPTLPPKINS
ncbi:MAG: hypothetical protein AAFQ80_15085 [Cyanobacteria bacterium J06621_8]